jgi:hypothetical protein
MIKVLARKASTIVIDEYKTSLIITPKKNISICLLAEQ